MLRKEIIAMRRVIDYKINLLYLIYLSQLIQSLGVGGQALGVRGQG